MGQTILTIHNGFARTFILRSLGRGSDDIDTLVRTLSKRLYIKNIPDKKSDEKRCINRRFGLMRRVAR